MHRTLKTLALAAALSAAAGGVAAQDFAFGWNPRTGDVWVDNQLNDINDYGYRYREPFIDEMVRYHDAPRDLVERLLVEQRWAPGDVYYACTLAQIAGQPCQSVVDRWDEDHGQGWGVVAQRMGIKPGSPEFHQLKKGFVPTYDRWARPIRVDETLHADFPRRGGGPHGMAVFEHPGRGDAHGRDDGSRGPGNSKGNGHGKGQAARADHAPGRAASAHGNAGGKGKPAGKGKDNGKGKGNGKGHGKGHG